MSDEVEPSYQSGSNSYINSQTTRQGALGSEWVQAAGATLLADHSPQIDPTALPLGGFDATTSTTSLDVTIATGEGFVGGSYIARDTTTTVTLDASTSGQEVYVGWDHNATNTVRIGKAGAFETPDPRLLIWTFDTDATGVTNAVDERPLEAYLDMRNERYEGDTSVPVDAAANANALGGHGPAAYFRSDINDTAGGVIGSTRVGPITGNLGDAQGEFLRAGGGASDIVYHIQGGPGRHAVAWNAYYDNTADVWKSIIGGEPCTLMLFQPFDPEGSLQGILFGASGGTTNAGDTVSWNWIHFTGEGHLDMNQNQVQSMVFEHRTTRPSNPEVGQIIYRTDLD